MRFKKRVRQACLIGIMYAKLPNANANAKPQIPKSSILPKERSTPALRIQIKNMYKQNAPSQHYQQ